MRTGSCAVINYNGEGSKGYRGFHFLHSRDDGDARMYGILDSYASRVTSPRLLIEPISYLVACVVDCAPSIEFLAVASANLGVDYLACMKRRKTWTGLIGIVGCFLLGCIGPVSFSGETIMPGLISTRLVFTKGLMDPSRTLCWWEVGNPECK
jgi:hypothetical protein